MIKRYQSLLNTINVLSDLVLVWLSCLCAWNLRFDVLNGLDNSSLSAVQLIFWSFSFAVVTVLVYGFLTLYAPQRLKLTGANTLRIFCGGGITSGLLIVVLFLFKWMDISRMAIILSWLIFSVFVSLKHLLLQRVLHTIRARGYNLKHYIIVGNGHLAEQYLNDLQNNPYVGICVDGYVSAVEKPELGTCLGSYEQLGEILANDEYDGLVIALEPHEVRFMADILSAADKEGLQVEMIPFFNDYYPVHPDFDLLGKSRLINLRSTPLNKLRNSFIKRVADILVSFILLLVLSPLMLLLAVGVRLSSPGPVIFRQQRLGKDKKPFTMYKFRSMRVTGSEDSGWSRNTDPRKTKFGSFIRKYSLDELPQFWNVLKGDMSLVGPRPEVPFHVNHFKEEIPRYLIRQQVRPGITGLAQINGFRGDTSIVERIRYDIQYIETWTVGLDLKILFRTVFGGMKNQEK